MTNALQSVPGVRNVEIDFPKKEACAAVEKGKLDQAVLLKALADAGYTNSSVKATKKP